MYNKTLDLKYYANINNVPVSDLSRKSSIKTENNLMNFSDSSWQDFPDTGRMKRACIIIYQGVPIDHVTHVAGPVVQSSAKKWVQCSMHCRNCFSTFKDVNSWIFEQGSRHSSRGDSSDCLG